MHASSALQQHLVASEHMLACLLSACCCLQISKTASQHMAIDTLTIVAMAGAALGVHILFLTVNTAACR
jgi:hypothetical protein